MTLDGSDATATSRQLLKFGKRGSAVDTVLYSDGFAEPVVQGGVTYVPLFPATE
jgi:hypothetical protein